MGPQVIPAPASAPLGTGTDRAIAFGGGGEWFTAWMLAYCATASRHGVDLATADVTVGTSAGSIMGAYLSGGKVMEAAAEFEQLAADPESLRKLVVTATGAKSQSRARRALAGATSTEPAAIRELGRVAMAARNVPVDQYVKSLTQLLGGTDWPSAAHHVTCVDCFTGERLVIASDSGVSIATACAASSSLPGVNGPTWVGDHYCMDGGVSVSSTHADLLGGANRVIIFSMMCSAGGASVDGGSTGFGFAERIHPGSARREADALESQGSRVLLVCANPDSGTDFMDPTRLTSAMGLGSSKAESDLDELTALWND